MDKDPKVDKKVIIEETKKPERRISKPDSKVTRLIKRPRNPYIHFIMDPFQREMASNGKLKGRELIRELGRIWKGLTIEEKKPYIELYQKEKQEYEFFNEEKSKISSNSVRKTSPNTPEGKRKKPVLKLEEIPSEEEDDSS
jgi:high mobility group protein B3